MHFSSTGTQSQHKVQQSHKDKKLDHSLSVVLPVHNAESTLARQVAELLDVLPELTSSFEVLIVDDGSTDQTEESAQELAREYPQLRVIRHAQRRGIPAVVQTGMEETSGDVVFVHDEQLPLRPSDLRRLWSLRPVGSASGRRLLTKAAAADNPLVGRLMFWGSQLARD